MNRGRNGKFWLDDEVLRRELPLPSLRVPEYRRRVLGLLLLRPDAVLHGRKIARRAGLPFGTITLASTGL